MDSLTMKPMYELLLSVPGMNETVRLDLKMSRKNVLFLCQLLTGALEDADSALLSVMSKESIDELKHVAQGCLDRSGLNELDQNLRKLT